MEQVYEGMTVVDQQGKRVGKVEAVKMGDPQAITTQGEELERDCILQVKKGSSALCVKQNNKNSVCSSRCVIKSLHWPC